MSSPTLSKEIDGWSLTSQDWNDFVYAKRRKMVRIHDWRHRDWKRDWNFTVNLISGGRRKTLAKTRTAEESATIAIKYMTSH